MSYWTEVDPPVSFIKEGWTYQQKREFRYRLLDYLKGAVRFDRFRGQKVLCVGDGGGIDAIEFARLGAKVTVIDLSEKAIALTRRHADEARVDLVGAFVADATQVPLDDGTFDAVYSFGVLHHIPKISAAIGEAHRLLRPEGTFIGMVYNRDSLLYAYSILARSQREGISAERAMQLYSERRPGCPHSVAYTKPEIAMLLQRFAGLVRVDDFYDVIDLPDQRKVTVKLATARNEYVPSNFGWHLLFEAIK